MTPRPASASRFPKAPSGIEGLDGIVRGGLPRECTTLAAGSPGSGKTVLARHAAETGIFVVFAEGATRLQVAGDRPPAEEPPAIRRRVSTGGACMDAMLRGGYLRALSVPVTGGPGRARTTLGGAFAQAVYRRGAPVLSVTFDPQAELGARVRALRRELAPGRAELSALAGCETGRERQRSAGTSSTRRLQQGNLATGEARSRA